MPAPCKRPRYRVKRVNKTKYVRLGYCGKKVFEAKPMKYKRR